MYLQKCTYLVSQPFTFDNFSMERPVNTFQNRNKWTSTFSGEPKLETVQDIFKQPTEDNTKRESMSNSCIKIAGTASVGCAPIVVSHIRLLDSN